jgi:hypothetical protein
MRDEAKTNGNEFQTIRGPQIVKVCRNQCVFPLIIADSEEEKNQEATPKL